MVFVPPGGFAGFAQQVPAVQRKVMRSGSRVASSTRRKGTRRRKKAAAAAPKRRRKSSGSRLKKGSAAAKAYMSKIRKLRGKARRKK